MLVFIITSKQKGKLVNFLIQQPYQSIKQHVLIQFSFKISGSFNAKSLRSYQTATKGHFYFVEAQILITFSSQISNMVPKTNLITPLGQIGPKHPIQKLM